MMVVVPGGSLRWDTRAAYFTGQRIKWKNNHLKAPAESCGVFIWTCSMFWSAQRGWQAQQSARTVVTRRWWAHCPNYTISRVVPQAYNGNLFRRKFIRERSNWKENWVFRQSFHFYFVCIGAWSSKKDNEQSTPTLLFRLFHSIRFLFIRTNNKREKIHVCCFSFITSSIDDELKSTLG